MTTTISSDDNALTVHEEDENIIIEELNDLYQVFLAWVFSSKRELDA